MADAWSAALKIPNVVQNLLGEGSLSASFIPVYARLLEEGREEEAGRVAGAVLGIVVTLAGGLAVVGAWAAPLLTRVIVFGFAGDDRADVVTGLLGILFPMTAVLVLSAWAVGILNSHRRFFASYVAPSLWNLSMIGFLVVAGSRGIMGVDLVVALGWGALTGGVLQVLFQLSFMRRYLKGVVPSLGRGVREVRTVISNFLPAVAARGAVNLSGLLDTFLASLLTQGANALIRYATTLYVLPISLFGMSIAAAELPELSRKGITRLDEVRSRTEQAISRVLFWLVPSSVGYVIFREEVMAVYRSGSFGAADATAVGWVLAVYTLGLPASGASRVLSSAFFSLGDTRTPARISVARIGVSALVGVSLMFPLDGIRIGGLGLGAAGLAAGASLGGWMELSLLRRKLCKRLSGLSLQGRTGLRYLFAAGVAAGVGLVGKALLPTVHPVLQALGTLLPFGVAYLLLTRALGVLPVTVRARIRRIFSRNRDRTP